MNRKQFDIIWHWFDIALAFDAGGSSVTSDVGGALHGMGASGVVGGIGPVVGSCVGSSNIERKTNCI